MVGPLQALQLAVLAVHLTSAVLFVGGSLFFWLVLEPASHEALPQEGERTVLVGRVARRFGRFTTPLLVVLIVTGLYNASWYLPGPGALFGTFFGQVLLAKSVTVAVLVALVYLHGRYYGPKIVALARAGKIDELQALRRRSRKVSYLNLGLMVVVLALAVVLQAGP